MTQPEIQLYWYWTTNPQKIRLVLEEWQLTYTCIKIDLARGADSHGARVDQCVVAGEERRKEEVLQRRGL